MLQTFIRISKQYISSNDDIFFLLQLEAVGIPKELSCAEGSIDEIVYAAISSIRQYKKDDDVNATCTTIVSSYQALATAFSNPDHSTFSSIAFNLAGDLAHNLCPWTGGGKASPLT